MRARETCDFSRVTGKQEVETVTSRSRDSTNVTDVRPGRADL